MQGKLPESPSRLIFAVDDVEMDVLTVEVSMDVELLLLAVDTQTDGKVTGAGRLVGLDVLST